MISSIRQLVDDCYEGGGHWHQPIRKVATLNTLGGYVHDMSMYSGNPRPNYYIGDALEAKRFTSAYGIWHSGDVSPAEKYVHKIMLMCTNAAGAYATYILCDYLLFYPLVDMDSTDEQTFTNTVTLPRYTDGLGVMMYLVATNPYTGGVTFNVTYTNQDGVSGKMTKLCTMNTLTAIATLVHSSIAAGGTGPFIPLAPGDRGVRSVESITFQAAAGGLASLVLCKPLAQVFVRDTNAPAEFDLLRMSGGKMPRVYDGAYLNFLLKPNGILLNNAVEGYLDFIWR